MTKNMGSADRVIRLILAVVAVVLIATGTVHGILAIVFGVLATIFVLTSLVGTCPLYSLFGLSTCRN